MNLRPPTFRTILALAGATLILWGAKGDILEMPVLGLLNLFQMNRSGAWTIVVAAVAVVGTSWLRPRAVAWLAWVVAVAALIYVFKDLSDKVAALKELGLPVDQILKDTRIKPGGVSVICGLLIQGVGLCLKRRESSPTAA